MGGLNNVFLPIKKKENESDQHSVIYLFDGSAFRLESREARPAPVVVPGTVASRQIFLRRVRNTYELNFAPTALPQLRPEAILQSPISHPLLHIVLEPRQVPGWPAGRVAEGLRKLLADNRVRAVVSAGGQEIPAENRQLEVLGSKVVLWSGELRDNWSVRLQGLPASLMQEPIGSASQNSVAEGRIGANQWIARLPITIPPVLLSDGWQINIKVVNRIYGRDEPARVNELCDFKLINRVGGSTVVLSQLTKDGDVLRSTARVDTARLTDARLELEVRPIEGSARCLQQSLPLPPLSWHMVENVATASAGVTLRPRGRWFLGLYAPQSIGAGMPVQASAQAIFEARSQIVVSLMAWLEASRQRFFAETDPSRAAVGFDLALITGADVPATAPFEEASVIVGKYRQPRTLQFRLDSTGEQRLERFLAGPRGTGSAPSFQALESVIARYSNLFGQLDQAGSAPIVVYLGAGTPNPDSCRDWTQMTANVRPVGVFAINFVSAYAAAIRQSLGGGGSAAPENSGTRVLGYSCKGEHESALLFAPFPDLVALAPDLVLQAIFDRLDVWLAARN